MGIENKRFLATKPNDQATRNQKTARRLRASHFEHLETRQLMSTTLPAAPPAGSTKLTGALIGTSGSYSNRGNTIANAIDGDTTTYFDAPSASGAWVGLNLGSPQVITQVQFAPRAALASRMVGGIFQGSSSPTFSSGVSTLYAVTSTPAATGYTTDAVTVITAFQYVRYLSPANSYGNIAEVEFDGAPASLPPPAPLAPINLLANAISATSVALSWQEDPSSVVTSYTIERQGPTDANFVAIGTTTSSAVTFSDVHAAPDTSYSYEVIANNLTGPSMPATSAPVTTPVAPPNPWTDTDIGAVGIAGSASSNSTTGAITVSGSGSDIWNQTDLFNFDSQQMVGNGTFTAQVTSQTSTSSSAKAGIMLRDNLSDSSRYVLLALTPGSGVVLQARTATHVNSSYSHSVAGKVGVWLELVRNGSTFSGYVSTNDTTWTFVGSVSIAMVNNVQAGLAVTAHNNALISTATFSGVSILPTGIEASAWSDGGATPLARWETANFTYNNEMYVFGGFTDRNLDATSECDVYNPATNSWSYVTTIPIGGLTHDAVTVVGDTAYFAGGNIGSFPNSKTGVATADVLSYNLVTGIWGSVASLPSAVTSAGMVCINDHLIFYGGINSASTADLNQTWSLDLSNPNANWVAEATMPNARNHIGYTQINGIAYAIGGEHLYQSTNGDVAEVDTYDPVANVWSKAASLPMPWAGLHGTTIVVNGKIVIVGGATNGGYDGVYLNNIEEYDPNANAWSAVGTIPEANQGESVAYIDGTLIVANGTVDNQGGWATNQTWLDSEIIL